MRTRPDITVTLNLHREGAFAASALASLKDLVQVAQAAGITVETQAILDCADTLTRETVELCGGWIDKIEEVSFADLGLSRNTGTRLSHGRFLAFLDGDDLWGERWLSAAFDAAAGVDSVENSVWHPQYLYVFTKAHDTDTAASLRLMQSSDTLGFNPALLVFGNLWSANTFAHHNLYERFPYCAADHVRGIGIEDWSWNLETIWAGVHHRVVPDTVHLIRRKETGSLDRQNFAYQLLPKMPKSLVWGETVLGPVPSFRTAAACEPDPA